jgi:hypothetical protein
MPDFEDVDIGGTIHIEFSINSGGWTGWKQTSTTTGFTFSPDSPARPEAHPVWDPARAKRMFRALSKRFHPDLNPDEIDGYPPTRWMADLNRVMQKRDMSALTRMAERFCPDSVSG